MKTDSIFFLILNATIVWAGLAWALMYMCRSKLLVLAILLAPFVIGSAFQNIAGIPQLLGFYGTSLLYGAFGIIFGVLYADYTRAKQYFQRVSKSSFVARGGIALSSMYLVSYFGQKIIFDNPMVEFLLGFIDGGSQAKDLAQQVDYDGAVTSAVTIAGGFAVLAFNKYREDKKAKAEYLQNQNNESKVSDKPTADEPVKQKVIASE
ncbi:MAG: hypothetical protein JKY08_05975 [Flavobacteriaceae bacterium]|nr:hypothetical protein [Flavobacteriaceae bacterium]